MPNYVFYDFETTGISPKFDQPLQFAAILTDDNFSPIEEVDIRCRLSDHILPSPIAMAVTGVTPAQLLTPELSYYEFSLQLAELINKWSPAVWTGYNSLSFDENVFRQMFYQNLHPSLYLTQINGNQRLDVLKAVYACWGYGMQTPQIPTLNNGKQTSRLDVLAPYNGFNEHHAHDALGDVKATIFIAKLIKDTAPAIWSNIVANRDKVSLTNRLIAGEVFQLVERWGAAAPKIYTGAYCGTHAQNKNQIGFFDLESGSIHDYLDGDPDMVSKAIEKSPKVIRTVDLNQMPLLFTVGAPTQSQIRDATLIKNSLPLQQAVGNALAERYVDREKPDQVEAQIYDGFYSRQDQELLRQFHRVEWSNRQTILDQLSDPRLKVLGMRLMVLYGANFVPEPQRREFWLQISRRWSGEEFYGESERDPGNTYESVARNLNELEAGDKFNIRPDEILALRRFYEKRKLSR